ncbi:MAG: hypothetical protein V4714_21680 [Bacteroidota bacterium]
MATLDDIKSLKRKYSAELLQLPGVAGIDIDIHPSGEATLAVHIDTKDPEVRQALPKELDGYPVKYIYTGPIRKSS